MAKSVEEMYQGCIIRNIRTIEASFNTPSSSVREKRNKLQVKLVYMLKYRDFISVPE